MPNAITVLCISCISCLAVFADDEGGFVRFEEEMRASATVAPAPKVTRQEINKLFFLRAGQLVLIDPDGRNETKLSRYNPNAPIGYAQLSPDGKWIAARYLTASHRVWKLYARKIDEEEPGTDLEVEDANVFRWSFDGTEIAYSKEQRYVASHGIVNVKTRERTALPLPDNHFFTDWSRDGQFFWTYSWDPEDKKVNAARPAHLMNRDGTERKALADGKKPNQRGQLSPDGNRVLYADAEWVGEPPRYGDRGLKVLDVATGKVTSVEGVPLKASVNAYCWSPDGKRIAYSWSVSKTPEEEAIEKETETFLVVSESNGKNAKTIATEKFEKHGWAGIRYINWR